MKGRRGNPGLVGRLLENSIEAYILSLETVNRLSIKYRLETFAYLHCNAWELLLKAKIADDARNPDAVYYARKRGQLRRSLTLRDCLERVFPNQNDPTRRNVERLADLRDEAVHLVIGKIPKNIIGLFQAGVINYAKRLSEWFGISLSDRVPAGMMSIVYDLSPEEFDLRNPVMRRQLGREAADYLMAFQAEVQREFDTLGKPAEFSIEIGYSLALVKKPGAADIVLTVGTSGASAQIVEVPKDSSKTHPLRRNDVITAVNATLAGAAVINQRDILGLDKVHKIKKRTEFFYQGAVQGSPMQYSQAFVEWIVKQHQNDPQFFEDCRAKLKQL